MSFCASCGRQRNGTARFCGGCGAEFGDSPAAADNQGSPVSGGTPGDPPRDATRMDVMPEVTKVEPDPFASWYQRQPQETGNDPNATWEPTQTVHATPTQGAGVPPSGFTSANPFSSANPVTPPGPPFAPAPPAGPPERGGRRALFIVLAVVVVLAAGGGAYAIATTLGKHSSAQPTPKPTVSTSATAPGSPNGGTTQQASSPAASASTRPTPSPALSLVAVAPGVTASAAEAQVETLLSHYFHGINSHSYAEYAGTLNPEQQAKQSEAQFNSGYSSTTDSGMTLTSLTDNGNGLTATVTFTSHQAPAQSADNSACNAWTLNLYLVPHGSGYLIGPAPSGYQPAYTDC